MRLLEGAPSQEGVNGFSSKLAETLVHSAQRVGSLVSKTAHRRRRRPHKPWFDGECFTARQEFFRIKNRVRFGSSDERRERLRQASREYKSLIKAKKREHFNRFQAKIRILKSNNSKEYWNLLNSATRGKGSSSGADIGVFKEHFEKLSKSDDEPEAEVNFGTDAENEFINRDFTVEEISGLIRKLKWGKACGSDSVRNEFLKSCPASFVQVITRLFNLILSTGLVPEDWCLGTIIPLFKNKGSRSDPDNYRGITLLSCISKLFTAAVNERLKYFLEGSGLLGNEQAGFRANFSTMDHILTLHMLIEWYKHKGKRLYCAFIDYKKAFDLVDRTALWSKVLACGIKGRIFRAVVSIYEKAKSCVYS